MFQRLHCILQHTAPSICVHVELGFNTISENKWLEMNHNFFHSHFFLMWWVTQVYCNNVRFDILCMQFCSFQGPGLFTNLPQSAEKLVLLHSVWKTSERVLIFILSRCISSSYLKYYHIISKIIMCHWVFSYEKCLKVIAHRVFFCIIYI